MEACEYLVAFLSLGEMVIGTPMGTLGNIALIGLDTQIRTGSAFVGSIASRFRTVSNLRLIEAVEAKAPIPTGSIEGSTTRLYL